MKEYIQQHQHRFLNELFDFLRIPSVSANPAHQADMLTAAEFVQKRLLEAGMDTAEI